MSASSSLSAQRRARLAAKRQTLYLLNITDDQLYKYVLRTGYVAYLLDPATQAKLHPPDSATPQPPKHNASSARSAGPSSAFGILDLLRDSSASKDSKSNKFPKELVQILSDKLQAIFMGRDPTFQDQLVRATFGAFFNHYVEPNYSKQVKENRKIEDLVLIFYSKATAELKKRTTGDEWRSLVDQHMALFIRMIQDCMKEHHLAASAPELMVRLAGYEATLLSETMEVLKPQEPASSSQGNAPEVSYAVQDMPLVSLLGLLFHKLEGHLQKDVDHLRVLASEQAALQDLKSYMKDLNTASPPSLRPNDFPDDISYEEWKHEESKAISELIVSMIEANPQLATFESNEVLSTLLSDPGERNELRRTVSDTPAKYFAEAEQIHMATNGKLRPDVPRRQSANDDHEDFIQRHTYTFIPEDPRAYYRRLLEVCLKGQMDDSLREESGDSLFCPSVLALLNECAVRWRVHSAAQISLLLDVVREMFDNEELDIEHIFGAFSMADNWNYSSWPSADKFLLIRTLMTMHESLLRELYNCLQKAFDPKPLNPRPINLLLDQYIYSNCLFAETEPDLAPYIADLEQGLQDRAEEVYNERRKQFLKESSLDLIHVHDYVDGFINDFERIHKRFKEPTLGKVDIFYTALDIFVPSLFRDVQTVLIELIQAAAREGSELPTDDIFAIYHKIKEAWHLYRQVVRKELRFDVKMIFSPAVVKLLEVTDAKAIEWVERAVHRDSFKPENDDLKQSSSVMDLFQLLGETVDSLKKLEWPDELEHARFATFLAGSLVRLNNIQYALLKLDALQNNLNVEALAAIIDKHTPHSAIRNVKQNFIFTIKIVSAEDLKPCDVNGLSDPYVVLSDEHGRRVAKTRTIWGDLNPRWDESFDVSTTGSLWLAATVWDRDKLVKNHDLCGRCYIKLDPGFFGDYLPRDLWLDLDTQGKLLLRVSMEGEKDDIQFYFGRAFRALKRAESDLTRKIVDTMNSFSRHCLSLSVIRGLVTTSSTQRITSWLGRTSLSRQNTPANPKQPKQALTDNEIEKAINPLLDYFDANFTILDQSLSEVASVIVMGKLWKAVLSMFEDLLLPPLSDKPSRMRQLSEPEVDIIYKWLLFLRSYFFAGGNGVPMDVLTSPKYNDILSVRFFYDESTENLICESAKIADQAYKQYEKRSAKPIPVAFSQPKSVLKYRSLGTIKLHKAKKRDAKHNDPNDDIVLRILRMRPGAENYLKDRFRQKNKLAATAAADGVLRGPRH